MVVRAFGVDDLVRLAVERNPRVARATIAIDAAQGRYLQAGLYPNPDLAIYWDEIGDRTSIGGSGIITAPRLTQTIVTGRKLTLALALWGWLLGLTLLVNLLALRLQGRPAT